MSRPIEQRLGEDNRGCPKGWSSRNRRARFAPAVCRARSGGCGLAGELEPEVAGADGALAAGRLRIRLVPQVEVHLHASLVRVVQVVPESAGGRGRWAQERLVVEGNAGVRVFYELRRQLAGLRLDGPAQRAVAAEGPAQLFVLLRHLLH